MFKKVKTVKEDIEKALEKVVEENKNKQPMTSKGLTNNNVCHDTVQAVSDQNPLYLFLQDNSDGKGLSI